MTTPSTFTQHAPESEAYRLAEKLLSPRYLVLDALAFAASLNPQSKKAAEDHKRQKEADRAQLMVLPIEELRARVAKHEAQAAAQRLAQAEADQKRKQEKMQREVQAAAEREAKKFYNQASSRADFPHWAKMDYWTFDEALALLMSLDPRVMTRAAMQKEMEPEFSLALLSQPKPQKNEFVRRYEALRAVAERATAMKPTQLRPADVVKWADSSGAIAPPSDLVQALSDRINRSQPQAPQITQPAGDLTPDESKAKVTASGSDDTKREIHQGTKKKWDAEALHELKAKRVELGTAGAAKHFGITATRVRQLLPQTRPIPTAANPFNLPSRTRRAGK